MAAWLWVICKMQKILVHARAQLIEKKKVEETGNKMRQKKKKRRAKKRQMWNAFDIHRCQPNDKMERMKHDANARHNEINRSQSQEPFTVMCERCFAHFVSIEKCLAAAAAIVVTRCRNNLSE